MHYTGNTIQERFIWTLKRIHEKVGVVEIAKRTGFAKSNVSEYYNGVKSPSKNFIKKYCEEFGFQFDAIWGDELNNNISDSKQEEGTKNSASDLITKYKTDDSNRTNPTLQDKMLADLIESNKKVVATNEKLVDNILELTKMVKANFAGHQATFEDVFSMRRDFLELLSRERTKDEKYESVEQARRILSSILHDIESENQ